MNKTSLFSTLNNKWRALGLALLVALVPIAAACGTEVDKSAEAATVSEAANSATIAEDVVVIDVRTTQEWNAGHLEGAIHISLEEPGFMQKISELDPDGEYLLYCRSGNRAGIAQGEMEALGITNITNLGSVANASAATGLVVTK